MSYDPPKYLPVPCLKCGARASADSDLDYPMCSAHMVWCEKCGIRGCAPDTDPPICTQCMAEKGGGNDPETENLAAKYDQEDRRHERKGG